MKRNIILLLIPFLTFLWSCEGEKPIETTRDPGVEFAPQMYHSIPLEPYSQTEKNEFFKDGKNAQTPPANTVARGKSDYYYPYPNNNEGYEAAGKELTNPLPYTKENIAEGKRLFVHFCSHCHGKKGKGDGSLVKAGKFPPPPDYSTVLKELPVGKMFHSITYGKNLMGSHAAQLSPKQRWQIIQYIQMMQKGVYDLEEGLKMFAGQTENSDTLQNN